MGPPQAVDCSRAFWFRPNFCNMKCQQPVRVMGSRSVLQGCVFTIKCVVFAEYCCMQALLSALQQCVGLDNRHVIDM